MPGKEQVPGEEYQPGERIRCLLLNIESTPRGPEIILSVEGKAVLTEADLRKALQAEKPGTIVSLRIYNPRAQARRVERVKLGDVK